MTGPPDSPDSLDHDSVATPEAPPLHPILAFTDADLAMLLDGVVRITLILGVVVAVVLWPAMGWQTAALFAVGAAISVASVYEWKRLVRIFNASMDQKRTPRGSGIVVALFLVRLILFGGAIYVSLKCLHGSPIALISGLALAVAGLAWESLKLLRG
jgi:hypothetical protein